MYDSEIVPFQEGMLVNCSEESKQRWKMFHQALETLRARGITYAILPETPSESGIYYEDLIYNYVDHFRLCKQDEPFLFVVLFLDKSNLLCENTFYIKHQNLEGHHKTLVDQVLTPLDFYSWDKSDDTAIEINL